MKKAFPLVIVCLMTAHRATAAEVGVAEEDMTKPTYPMPPTFPRDMWVNYWRGVTVSNEMRKPRPDWELVKRLINKYVMNPDEIFTQVEREESALGWAAKHNNLDMVNFLLERHANPNLGKTTPLTYAKLQNNADMVRALVRAGGVEKRPAEYGWETFKRVRYTI